MSHCRWAICQSGSGINTRTGRFDDYRRSDILSPLLVYPRSYGDISGLGLFSTVPVFV